MLHFGAGRKYPRKLIADYISSMSFSAPLTSSVIRSRGFGAPSYTRATTASIEDHESVVRYCLSGEARFKKSRRVRNLVSWDLSGAGWSKIAAGTGVIPVVTPGQTAPDGTATAYRVQLDRGAGTTSGDLSYLSASAPTAPGPVAGNVLRSTAWIRSNTGSPQLFNLRAGNKVTLLTATTEWRRLDSGTGSWTANYAQISATGNTTAQVVDLLVWHPQLEDVSDQANQNPSEEVSNGAPKLNELIQTQNFDSASWTKTRSSITANAVAAPNGTLTADKLVEDTTVTNSHLVSMAGIPLDASVRELFVFAKQAERSALFIQLYDGTTTYSGNFNLATGSVGTTSNATSSITPLSDGWYRCAIVTNTPTAAASGSVTYSIQNPLGTNIYTGDGTSGLYLWEGGLRRIDVAGDYFSVGNVYPFHGAMVDGVKYFDDTNGNSVNSNVVTEAAGTPLPTAGRGYLPEDSRFNLFLRSSEFDNASWIKTDTTVTANATTAPDGTATMDLLTQGAAGTASVSQVVTGTADVSYLCGWYFKYFDTQWVRLLVGNGANSVSVWADILNGVIGSVANAGTGTGAAVNIEPAANGAFRVWITGAVGSGATAITALCYATTGDGSATRANGGSYYLWGADFNNNTTTQRTHIPTAGSTVLQNSDTLTYPAVGNAGVSGTLYTECGPSPVVNLSFVNILDVSDGTSNNFYSLQNNLANARASLWSGGVAQGSPNAVAWTNGTSAKVAGRFGTNTIQFAKGGTLATEDTAVSLPVSVSVISIGTAYGGTGGRTNMPIQFVGISPLLFNNLQLTQATR